MSNAEMALANPEQAERIRKLYEQVESGEVKTVSQFQMRNEQAQNANRMSRIPRLKREFNKNAKLVLFTELALPIDPKIGKETDEINASRKWRPLMTTTTASLLVKLYASMNEDTKNELMKRANVKEWDVSDISTLTDQDKAILRQYRVPRIFTAQVITVKDKLVGGDFSKNFIVDVKKDPMTGKVIGEMPVFLKIAKLWRDYRFEEMTNIKTCIELSKKGEEYVLKSTNEKIRQIASTKLGNITDKQYEEVSQEVYGDVAVTNDHPSNFLVLYELPLNDEMDMTEDKKWSGSFTAQDLDKCMVHTSLTKEIKTKVFDQFNSPKWAKHDTNWDFYEVDMSCPVAGSCLDEPKLIGLNTRYEKPNQLLSEKEYYPDFLKMMTEVINEEQKLEQRFLQSTYLETYENIIGDQLVESLGQTKLLDAAKYPFLTSKVAKANKDILVLAYGKKADQFFMELEVGISDAAEGDLDEGAAESAASDMTSLLTAGAGTDDGTALSQKDIADLTAGGSTKAAVIDLTME